ncbi:hypothetical protein ACK2M2_11200 [Acinetobacter sp. TY1]|uniref:hypothetical protein n=1 Tax=Acinetobacter sp. TY1 TaxID=3387626 RepID=UPI003AF97920
MEYPKMLYLGSTTSHQNEIAQNAEHEAELRELGFVDFVDLEDEVNQMMGSAVGGAIGGASSEGFRNAFVPVEQFDAVSEDLVQKELQLSVAQTERDQFKAENDDLKAQIEQLNQVIDSFQPAEHVVVETDYNGLTADQLRTLLDEKGIKYLARDDKPTLIGLLTQPAKKE